jgi:CIC family chloride channel protein
VFGLAALTGGIVGAGVAAFDAITREGLFDYLKDLPVGVQVVAPLAGLLLALAAVRSVGHGATPSTTDEYILNFHDADRRLDQRPVPGRLLASMATLGLGGAMGYEGPSMYLGAAVGSALQARLGRLFSADDTKVLLVAGAAAGMAAIFKAPATGLVFALEVPYKGDFAGRMLLPAGIAAAVSYVVFVAFEGTARLFAVNGAPPFDLLDLAGAVLVGLLCGASARLFALALEQGRQWAARLRPLTAAVIAGVGIAGLAALSFELFGEGLTLGAGYDNLQWALDPNRGLDLVLALLAMRAVATLLTVGGGGAGGLVLPLVVEGALIGRLVGGLVGTAATGSNLFPLVGVSAFLGAGYRTPLAGVVFAAETSGRPGFIVPGLIAAVVARLLMGKTTTVAPDQAG